MSLEESFLQNLRELPPDKQREAFEFVESLHHKTKSVRHNGRTVKGLWSDLGIDVTAEDITEARFECWSNFPKRNI